MSDQRTFAECVGAIRGEMESLVKIGNSPEMPPMGSVRQDVGSVFYALRMIADRLDAISKETAT